MSKRISPVSVRLTEEAHARAVQMSAKTGVDLAVLGRLAFEGLLDYYDAHDQRITLPLDFTKFFTDLRALLDRHDSGHLGPADEVYTGPLRAVAETHDPAEQSELATAARKRAAYRQTKP